MTDIQMSDSELLKYAIDSGILDAELVKKQVEMQKREEILKKHPYKIWFGNDGFWHTYLATGEKRKAVKKLHREDLENAIIECNNNTFKVRHEVWVERQRKCGVCDNTICKYESDYLRFFSGSSIEYMNIQDITDDNISEFINKLLQNKEIPYRALKGMFGYMNGIFEKSIRDKLIKENPCNYVDLKLFKKKCTETKKKTARERTLSAEESSILLKKLKNTEQKLPSIQTYAVELSLYTGMRVGELSGLMWKDIDFENETITICHSEKYNRKTHEYYISTTKTGNERIIPLTRKMKDILLGVKKVELKYGWISDFVFSNQNGRIHTMQISWCATQKTSSKEFCNKKSIHAIRRTLNSNMRCMGVSKTVAASILGHSEDVNERNYTYDVSSRNEKCDILEKASNIS